MALGCTQGVKNALELSRLYKLKLPYKTNLFADFGDAPNESKSSPVVIGNSSGTAPYLTRNNCFRNGEDKLSPDQFGKSEK